MSDDTDVFRVPSASWLFVETELVAHWIGERRERAHAGADFLARRRDASTGGLDLLQRRSDVVDHDVGPRALVRSAVALLDPRSTNAAGIIEGEVAIAARPDLPSKDAAVELG